MSMLPIAQPSIAQPVTAPILTAAGVRLHVLREDLIHPTVSGNKWRKLRYNLARAKAMGHHTLLTFGGAYSNHLFATAAAAKVAGFKSIGVVRGEPRLPLNPTLDFAKKQGMRLHYIDRAAYRQKDSTSFGRALKKRFGPFYHLPEGGTNALALKGCAKMVAGHEGKYDYWCCAMGTGGTFAGIVAGLGGVGSALGFPVLKNGGFLAQTVETLLTETQCPTFDNWSICTDYHFGGYAKHNPTLVAFINQFKNDHGIPLDPIYTGKLLYGIMDKARQGYFPKGSTILAVHTGGLQGIAGFNARHNNAIKP